MIEGTERWTTLYPGAVIGILVMHGAHNLPAHGELDGLREQVERELRGRFGDGGKAALNADPVMAAYQGYYKHFRKTYHVILQRESIVWKDRRIPSISALVQAMFMAELKNGLLTAGHDLGNVELPVRISAGTGAESYVAMNGEKREVKDEDMMISDARGIISSIIGGPDQRTAISQGTKDLLFTVYAPSGIGAPRVRSHLADIRRFVEIVAPDAVTESLETYPPDGR